MHNPNNWHWVDRNCLPWAKSYFQERLPRLELAEHVKVVSVTVTGDCDVSNRKGKVICIYDLVVDISLEGTKDGEDVKGTIKVKEFIHDESDYEWEYSGWGAHKTFIVSQVQPLIYSQLAKFQDELIESQEKDLQQNNVAH